MDLQATAPLFYIRYDVNSNLQVRVCVRAAMNYATVRVQRSPEPSATSSCPRHAFLRSTTMPSHPDFSQTDSLRLPAHKLVCFFVQNKKLPVCFGYSVIFLFFALIHRREFIENKFNMSTMLKRILLLSHSYYLFSNYKL